MKTLFKTLFIMASLASLAACGSADRLKNVGKRPALSAISSPTAQAGYKPVRMPMPTVQPAHYNANSLWKSGSRAFFNDQRARKVGDILTVLVKVSDSAKIANQTSRSRKGGEDMGATGAVGNALMKHLLPSGTDASALVKINSGANSQGTGSVDRSESVTTTIAAIVTQVLPNGNLVVEGKQEIRINFEIREMIVAGVVRPEDIGADNTIESTKIAQARISYGGRGQISDVQQPRYGQQVLDVLLPF